VGESPKVVAQFGPHSPADGRSTPEQNLLAVEKMKMLRRVVDRLSERQRVIFLLRFIEEMTLAEIARVMNLQMGTVKAHLFRATSDVRRELNDAASK